MPNDFNRELSVSADDIRDGVPGSPCGCPVALMLKREFPNARDVEVDCFCAVWKEGTTTLHFSTQGLVDGFINRFDTGEPVEPFTFHVTVHSEEEEEEYDECDDDDEEEHGE